MGRPSPRPKGVREPSIRSRRGAPGRWIGAGLGIPVLRVWALWGLGSSGFGFGACGFKGVGLGLLEIGGKGVVLKVRV